jgi:hypothetical protein
MLGQELRVKQSIKFIERTAKAPYDRKGFGKLKLSYS